MVWNSGAVQEPMFHLQSARTYSIVLVMCHGPEDYVRQMIQDIVAFALRITRLEEQLTWSQNRSQTEH